MKDTGTGGPISSTPLEVGQLTSGLDSCPDFNKIISATLKTSGGFLDLKLRRTRWQLGPAKKDKELLVRFPGAVRGNRIDAYRKGKRSEDSLQRLAMNRTLSDGTLLWITNTLPYDSEHPTEKNLQESWEKGFKRQRYFEEIIRRQEEPAKRTRKRRISGTDYITAIEAHAKGGFHCHTILHIPGKRFETYTEKYDDRGKELKHPRLRLTDKEYERAICEAWNIGDCRVYVIRPKDVYKVGSYISKEIVKQGNCEDAIIRWKRNWTGKDWKGNPDSFYLKNDLKKIFRQYFGRGRKLLRYSKSLEAQPRKIEDEYEDMKKDLPEGCYLDIKDDQVSDCETPRIVAKIKSDLADRCQTVEIPYKLVFQRWFNPKTGPVDLETDEGRRLSIWYRQKMAEQYPGIDPGG